MTRDLLCTLEFTKVLLCRSVAGLKEKKLYYISAEFLIAFLSNNLINLGIYDDVLLCFRAPR